MPPEAGPCVCGCATSEGQEPFTTSLLWRQSHTADCVWCVAVSITGRVRWSVAPVGWPDRRGVWHKHKVAVEGFKLTVT